MYLPWPQGKWSDLHIGVCESLFPLVYQDRLLCSRVPNKYLVGKTQTTATLVTRCSRNALIQPCSRFQLPLRLMFFKTDNSSCTSSRIRLCVKSYLSVNPALAGSEEGPCKCVILQIWLNPLSFACVKSSPDQRNMAVFKWELTPNVSIRRLRGFCLSSGTSHSSSARLQTGFIWPQRLDKHPEKDGKANRGGGGRSVELIFPALLCWNLPSFHLTAAAAMNYA